MISDLMINTQYAFYRLPNYLKFKNLSIIQPYCSFEQDHTHYTVKVANQPDELAQVLKLRFEVFFREFSGKKIKYSFFPYDIDAHDFSCDHLIVKDKAEDKVVAVYRLLHSDAHSGKFYSEGEFNLTFMHSMEGSKIELGRACVDKQYRNGTVVSLLWKGLLEYARLTRADYMFGCSSIARKDFANFQTIMQQLADRNSLLEEGQARPVKSYHLHSFPEISKELENSGKGEQGMNSLMHMYVMAGAKMGREVAYDKEMDCLDLFTLIDLKKLPASFERRFS